MRKTMITSALAVLCLAFAPASHAQGNDDRTDILQTVVYPYAYAWDDLDCAKFASVFASDGVLDFRGHPTLAAPDSLSKGRAQVRKYCQTRVDALTPGFQRFHYMTNPIITVVSPTKATGQIMAVVLTRTSPTTTPTVSATIRYKDTYVKRSGRWLLLKRVVS